MKHRSSAGLWVMAWLLVAVAAPAFTGSGVPDHRARDEHAATVRLLGDRARWLPAGAVGRDTASPALPWPPAARSALPRVDRYAAAFVHQWHTVRLRFFTLCLWWAVLSPLVVATVVDGLAGRAILAANFGFRSPAAFSLARRIGTALGVLPAFALLWPALLPAPWAVVCCVVSLLPLRLALVHLPSMFPR